MKIVECEKFNDLPDVGEVGVMYRVKELEQYVGKGYYVWRPVGCYELKYNK